MLNSPNPSSSSPIIELLLAKGTISLDTLDNIIKSIKASKVSNTDNSVAKEQLLLIAQSFNKNNILKEKLKYPILDFFKSHNDSPLLLELIKTIDNHKFFEPISDKLKSQLQCLGKLLEIENLVSTIPPPTPSQFNLSNSSDIITKESSESILKLYNIDLKNVAWSYNQCIKEITIIEKQLKQLLRGVVSIDIGLISKYDNYLIELLSSTYFKKIYLGILQNNTEICTMLLKQGYPISGKCLEVLIQCLDKHPTNNTNHIGNISEILSTLASQNKMPVLGINISIALIQDITKQLNQNIINNIVGVFESLAGFNIQNNDLTDAICEKYLGQSLVTARILQALDIIATNTSLLPEKAVSSLVKFIDNNTDNIVALRIRAIEILQKVAGTVKEDDISNLSKLLQGEKKIISDDDELIDKEPSTISSETMDYMVALATTKLLASYAARHGSLTTASLNYLEQALNNDVLAADSLTALAFVAEKDPNLLNPKLLDYIKECDPQIHQQILFNASLDLLDELLKQNNLKLIKEQLDKLTELLRHDNVHHTGKLYQIIDDALIAKPTLFAEYLSLVKLATTLNKNTEIINKLIKFEQITYQDLCWFINKGYYSEELYNATEKYFNSNIDKLQESRDDLGEMLESLNSLVGMKGKLALDTINNLINLAKALPHQAVNIIRIIYLTNASLDDHHFSLLEQLFTTSDKQLTLLLITLWAKANRQLTSTESVAVVFGSLGSKTPLEILPNSQQEQAKILLQLQASEQLVDKLSLLTSLEGKELPAATINTILQLIKIKDLSKGCIKVLASLASPPYLDEEVSEIICQSQDGLDNEYLKLKPFLSGDVEFFLLTDKQRAIKNIIEERFPHVHLTNSELKKLEANLDINTDSLEFMEEILLGDILEKASSIEEYSSFLELINKHKISQQEIVSNLGQPNLAVIIDVIETKILYELLKSLENLGVDDELGRISHFCYQLKSNGWPSSSLIEILQHINASNIKFFVNSFRTIYEYKITTEQRNKKGETITDITGRYTGEELEPTTFSIASNQFEHKLENKGEVLLKKVVDLNPNLAEKAIKYQDTLQRIHSLYSSNDNGLAIENWTAEQVKDWAINFKASCAKHEDLSNKENCGNDNGHPNNIPKDDIATVIAALQRANNLHTEQKGKAGHLLRDTQIISLLLLLDYDSINNQGINKGKLLQISTGEGKSTISAMLASILALRGEKVDLITSSSVLSTIGYEGAKDFFERLGLSVGINIAKPGCTGQKACYSCDIVYGDALSFQADFLSNTSFQGARRGDRDFAVAIVDEVDSMLVDSSNHIAKQTTPIPLMEYLLPILTIASDNFQKVILPMDLPPNIAIEKARELIEGIISGVPIPKHLKHYAMFQAGKWAASLVGAIELQLDRDYVINIHEDGHKVINPVDNSTGVTQENMVWQDGLHQFLQIKHNCRISAEGLSTFFITNIAYFLKYNKVLGMTGTLGSDSSQEFLKTIYGVELSFVPTYKDKQVIELPARLETSLEALRETVCNSSYQEAVLHNRAVLIVCENIKEAEDVCQSLKDKCGNKAKIINYSRSEEKLYNSDIEQWVQPKTIIVATNLAGRGTDIRTSGEVEANGGLHVISTFIAKNARDEAQVKGRTARQGNSGSYQIIACVLDYDNYQAFEGVSDEEIINIKKQQRDRQESQKISYNIEQRIPALLADDKLYQKFTASYLELAGVRGERAALDYKIKQFIEEFGLWFKTHKEDGSIESFIASAKSNYQSGTCNPSYAVLQHFGISNPWTVLVALSKATSIDDIYNFPAYYYAAKCWLDIGPKDEKNYKNKAIESLMDAGNRLSEILSYLTAMSVSVASKTGSDNELLHQITTKIGFFKSFFDHIQSAIKLIPIPKINLV